MPSPTSLPSPDRPGSALGRRAFLAAAGGALASCTSTSSLIPSVSGGGGFALGIDVLSESGFAAVRGARVGLITNQTSADRSGTRTRSVLQRGLGQNLTALFTPEHGLDGTEKAGNKVPSRMDPLTGVVAWSLYGDTRKPTGQMLAGIDAMLFDLQDIGSRSYTYISTMALAMEACAEHGKTFIVLDRPNPMGGHRIQGPPLESRWKSFVGQIPVPYVHGMTAGELARMICARGWISRNPKLQVIPMRGWQRGMMWRDTGLRWIPTSPNIPHAESPLYYAATGMLGGLNGVDIGIGSTPFECAAGRGVNPDTFAASMNARRIPGVQFSPWTSSRKPGFAGARLKIDPHGQTDLVALDVLLCAEICRLSGGEPLRQTTGDTLTLFHKVYGSDSLWNHLRRGTSVSTIMAGWQSANASFRSARQPYLLYP